MCATGFAHPTPHSPVSVSLTLVPTCQEILHCNEDGTAIDHVDADDATGRRELRGRSNAWRIDNPVLLVTFITLNSAVQAAYDRELSSSGLVMVMRTYSVITSAIQQSIAEIPFFIAASNLTDVYFVFSHNFSAKAADGTENVAFLKGQAAPGADDVNRAQVHFRRQFKDCNFHPYPQYMLKHGLGATASHTRLGDNLFQQTAEHRQRRVWFQQTRTWIQ